MNIELFRKKVRGKGTKKEEKEILKQLKVKMGKELTSNNLRIAQEQRIHKLRHKKVKFEKNYQKEKKKARQHQVPAWPKKDFLKHWRETRHEKVKFLRLRNLSIFRAVFGRKNKEHQIYPGWREWRDFLVRNLLLWMSSILTEKTKEINQQRKELDDLRDW